MDPYPMEELDSVQNSIVESAKTMVLSVDRIRDQYFDFDTCKDAFNLREFKTLRFYLPRRAGNTTTALKLLKEFKKSIFITIHQGFANEAKKTFEAMFDEKVDANRFFSFGRKLSSLRGTDIKDTVFIIDSFSLMKKKEIEDLYNLFAKYYIMIG